MPLNKETKPIQSKNYVNFMIKTNNEIKINNEHWNLIYTFNSLFAP